VLPRRTAPLIAALAAVHPFGIGRWAGDAIALAEPVQQVAVLAAAAAKGCMLRRFGLAAQRAAIGLVSFGRFGHESPKW